MIRRNHLGYRVGEGHHRAKLTDKQVARMRWWHEQRGIGYRRLAQMFGCGQSTARDICTYRTRWAA